MRIQLHHIDENPANSVGENLAVLCFECHHKTQISGGFDRKLDAHQVRLYRTDWLVRVGAKREADGASTIGPPTKKEQALKYLQLTETSDEYAYDFSADYVLVQTSEPSSDAETNIRINSFVTGLLQRFRRDGISRIEAKEEMKTDLSPGMHVDAMWVSHSISLFTPRLLSVEFQLASYYAGAAHPNTSTRTLNLMLHPSLEMELPDIFGRHSEYLTTLSNYCVDDLHRQQPARWHNPGEREEWLKQHKDHWITSGAAPEEKNFKRMSLRKNGIAVHFDPYQVGSYAEGKYEVFVPLHALRAVMNEEVYDALC